MNTRIKICGFTREEDVQAAVAAGAAGGAGGAGLLLATSSVSTR